jgi:hypothetical protein
LLIGPFAFFATPATAEPDSCALRLAVLATPLIGPPELDLDLLALVDLLELDLPALDLLELDLPELDLLALDLLAEPREPPLDFELRELPPDLVGPGERPFDPLLELEFLLVFVCAISPSFQANVKVRPASLRPQWSASTQLTDA